MLLRSMLASLSLALLGVVTGCSALETDSAPLGEIAPAVVPGLAGPPARVEGVVTATEGDHATTLLFTPPQSGGSRITGYEYDVSTDDEWRPLAADSIVRDLSNGTSYRFRVRAVNARGPSGSPSDPSNVIVPYGVPESPVVSGKTLGAEIEWTWTAPNGNGRTVTGYQSKLDAAPYGATSLSTSFRATVSSGAPHTLCVKAFTNGDAGRNESAEQCSTVGE